MPTTCKKDGLCLSFQSVNPEKFSIVDFLPHLGCWSILHSAPALVVLWLAVGRSECQMLRRMEVLDQTRCCNPLQARSAISKVSVSKATEYLAARFNPAA